MVTVCKLCNAAMKKGKILEVVCLCPIVAAAIDPDLQTARGTLFFAPQPIGTDNR